MSTVKANAADEPRCTSARDGARLPRSGGCRDRARREARADDCSWRLLIVADLIGLVTALLLSGLVTAESGIAYLLTLPAWLVAARIYGLYTGDKRHTNHSTIDEVAKVFHFVTVGTWIAFLASWLLSQTADAGQLIGFWASAIALIVFNRGVVRAVSRRRAAYIQNAVIVGAGDIGQLIGRKLLQHPEYGINLVGFVDAEPKELRKELHGITLLGAPAELRQIVEQHGVDRVIIAFSNDPHAELLDAIRSLPTRDVQVDIVPRLFEVIGSEFGVHDVEGLPLLGLLSSDVSRGALVAKRCLDAVGATLAIALIAPLFPLIALLIKLDSPGPVFFKQKRLGMGMREFSMLKFRTMRTETDEATHREYVRGDHDHERRAWREQSLQARSTGCRDAGRKAAAQLERRRAAPAAQRAPGRHVSRRPASLPALRDGDLRAPSLRAVSPARRPDRTLAGDGASADDPSRGARPRRRLRARLVARPRSASALAHALSLLRRGETA